MNRTATVLAIPALALALGGCATELLEMESPPIILTEAHGPVWMPADEVEHLQCDDGLLLVCDTADRKSVV